MPQMKKLRKKKMAKVMPGNKNAVSSVSAFHWWPLNALYVIAAEYPATDPMSTKSSNVTVSIEPRLAGDKKPSAAHAIEMNPMPSSCMPVPTDVASSVTLGGVRSTSACTSFHPDSSSSSSFSSTELYSARSRRRVRTMIIATIPESRKTMTSELRMENQWT